MPTLFPQLYKAPARPALRFGDSGGEADEVIDYGRLAGAARSLALRIADARRVAVWATPSPHTCVGVLAALLAGVPAVPVNPRIGDGELAHILSDSTPSTVLAAPGDDLPEALAALPRADVPLESEEPGTEVRHPADATEPDENRPALIVYTSGTTGPPKGVVLPRRAIAVTLDDLADAWGWTGDDVLVHALPLFHVHGLILGVLGPLRHGGTLHHLGRFSPGGVAAALEAGGTMLFGVPTMYHRLAEVLDGDGAGREGSAARLASALRGARLLVSGSAALPRHDHERIEAATGRRVVERYGMTETLMITSVRPDGASRPGTVGTPLRSVDVRLVDEQEKRIEESDGETVGEIQVRGPNLFTEYLGRPDATADAFAGGWFRTGDMAVRDADGHYRIVGRKSTDLIKSGGYKIGAGEIENCLLGHPAVAEAAVTGEPDPDLGERIVAWVVPAADGPRPGAEELAGYVAGRLAPHKRPRTVRFLAALPRNDMGKVMKRELSHG
ncbi:acyl-CoA synthetase [Streptomyces sp. TRM 70361]|uniref:acyl-CoA synthetase n=1 Tax=Streptomyces sp. TRM 70361 TaxID=3116553 RepID=UPI002E7AE7F5|nr:acyl-CoA synthetase [Streptomyces sp. TRM 70361]MEE1940696.1 acyl-CoA synthetase [Streptomyces sp. TRM 70361]